MTTDCNEAGTTQRLAAMDWCRGIVMVLMAIDHASEMLNAGRLSGDSAFPFRSEHWAPGMVLDGAQFFTRWITHLCAPTFLFLAGTALAISVERRLSQGDSVETVDKHLLIRGLVILGFELFYLSLGAQHGGPLLQVLYAIGFGLILMIPLRRLGSTSLVALALAWFFLGELATTPLLEPTLLSALFVSPGRDEHWLVLYPVMPWLAMMMLGWAFGRFLLAPQGPQRAQSVLLLCGLAAIALFALVRGLNSYGNMLLLREDLSWTQWLHVSKYPPSLTYACLELGIMALLLSALMKLESALKGPIQQNNPILVFGQTALFFYLIHFIVLGILTVATVGMKGGGLIETYAAALTTLIILYPICRWYRRYKSNHPDGFTQYI